MDALCLVVNGERHPDIIWVPGVLDVLRQDGSVADTLAELRRKWGKEIPALLDRRFDDIALQYIRLPHEAGIAALGQELTACGYNLYDLDGEDMYLLTLVPKEKAASFEHQLHEAGAYCRQVKQNRRAPGQHAKKVDPGKQMECQEEAWAEEGLYTPFSFAGDFACGYWRRTDDEKWQGPFVANLKDTPPQPIKLKRKDFRSLVYSAELGFYAGIYRTSLKADYGYVAGGKNPAEADAWPLICNWPVSLKYRIQWCGPYLCVGDTDSVTLLLMTKTGVKDVNRLILPKATEPASFAMDGKGTIYIQTGCTGWNIIRYDGNRKFSEMRFPLAPGNTFAQGTLPVPGTTRLLLLHSYNTGRGGLEPALLDLDMATQQCRIAPLRGLGDGFPRLRAFTGDWALIEETGDYGSHRFDYAQLWNRRTGEVLRLRPGMFGGKQFEGITALTDGTIAVKLLRDKVGRLMYYPADFWNFLRRAGRVRKLDRWLNFPIPYPGISYELPPESDEPSLMLPPPYLPAPQPPAPEKKEEPAKAASPRESMPEQAADAGIELDNGTLRIHGKTLRLPLSYIDLLKALGSCRTVIGPQKVSYLIWDEQGITAVRSKKNPYLMATLYIRLRTGEAAEDVPAPRKPFKGSVVIDGKELAADGKETSVHSGDLEITVL